MNSNVTKRERKSGLL